MMMNNTTKNRFKINQGTVIIGKWYKQSYTIVKELGYGANGTVFLAESKTGKVAIKLSGEGTSITSEVNVLKSFAKVQGYHLGPSLIDVDDWVTTSGTISFYAMEYINGPDLLTFMKDKEAVWMQVMILQLLKDLQILHKQNWVFGDLKPENLIITGSPTRIRCIDVGGTTIQGRAIKEFTEFFDRGYWGLGTRKADPTYDLFAVAMIIINIFYPNRFHKKEGGLKQLQEMIHKKKELHIYEPILINAFQGKYKQAQEMRQAIMTLQNRQGNRSSTSKNTQGFVRAKATTQGNHSFSTVSVSPSSKTNGRVNSRKNKKKTSRMESLFLIVVISICYFLYIYSQLT